MNTVHDIIDQLGSQYAFTIINGKAKCISVSHSQHDTLLSAKNMMKCLPIITSDSIYYLNIIINDMTIPIYSPVMLSLCEYKLIDDELQITKNRCTLWMSNDNIINNMFNFKNIRQIITNIHGTDLCKYSMKPAISLL